MKNNRFERYFYLLISSAFLCLCLSNIFVSIENFRSIIFYWPTEEKKNICRNSIFTLDAVLCWILITCSMGKAWKKMEFNRKRWNLEVVKRFQVFALFSGLIFTINKSLCRSFVQSEKSLNWPLKNALRLIDFTLKSTTFLDSYKLKTTLCSLDAYRNRE